YGGQGMHPVHGRRPKTGLAPENAQAGHDQIINRRLVLVGAMLAIGGDGAVHQAWVERSKPVKRHDGLPGRGGGKVFDQDIDTPDQVLKEAVRVLCCGRRLRSVRAMALGWRHELRQAQPDAFLPPVPDQITIVPRRRVVCVDHPDDACTMVAEQHGGQSPSWTVSEVQYRYTI